ncbi:MAG: hypothetical protein VKJ87_04315, partial [Synechococcus sp.]|nr:hypothetical protein [Synechococcus sp.]
MASEPVAGVVELLHVDTQRVIVRVSALAGRQQLSALGEAAGAEQAEDRARQRLQQALARFGGAASAVPAAPSAPVAPQQWPVQTPPPTPTPTPAASPAVLPSEAAPVTAAAPEADPTEPPAEPEDWSEELTAVEMELQRLGWDRDQEGTYLQRAFGHPSRSRLVNYADMVSYLKALRCLEPGCSAASAVVPLRRSDLLRCSDELLGQLQWGAAQGRQFLEEQFGKGSRQQLSDEQLLVFNQQ